MFVVLLKYKKLICKKFDFILEKVLYYSWFPFPFLKSQMTPDPG